MTHVALADEECLKLLRSHAQLRVPLGILLEQTEQLQYI